QNVSNVLVHPPDLTRHESDKLPLNDLDISERCKHRRQVPRHPATDRPITLSHHRRVILPDCCRHLHLCRWRLDEGDEPARRAFDVLTSKELMIDKIQDIARSLTPEAVKEALLNIEPEAIPRSPVYGAYPFILTPLFLECF